MNRAPPPKKPTEEAPSALSVADTYQLREVDEAAAGQGPDLAATAQQIGELRAQVMRLAAELENHRRRSKREQEETRRYGIDRLLGDLLPTLDNLERALALAGNSHNSLVEGIKMVVRGFVEVLANHGVVGFVAQGMPFDPVKHDAVGQKEDTRVAPGTVIEEHQRGYMLHNRLLRPARVVVAAYGARA